ncbi:MAG: PHP domain-containing protein [Gammaproteobacteria bacterium]|nr:PHP domain-containing protein [Gammaproteobacteria bacterium]
MVVDTDDLLTSFDRKQNAFNVNPVADLHTHTLASDGTLSASDLVALAVRYGVNLLALTDHDELDGCREAATVAQSHGIAFINGVEISVTWQARTIHIVGLNVDTTSLPLQQGLAKNRTFRDWRAEEMGRRLAKQGIVGGYEAAAAMAMGRIVSRTHFAKFLVSGGYASDLREVFKHYLKPNKPGYVAGEWATLEAAVGWIREADGIAVIAHPARYNLSATKLRLLLQQFIAAGGEAIEVVSSSHNSDDILHFADVAKRYQLLASVGSDFHDPNYHWNGMGRLPPLPATCEPIWSRW